MMTILTILAFLIPDAQPKYEYRSNEWYCANLELFLEASQDSEILAICKEYE